MSKINIIFLKKQIEKKKKGKETSVVEFTASWAAIFRGGGKWLTSTLGHLWVGSRATLEVEMARRPQPPARFRSGYPNNSHFFFFFFLKKIFLIFIFLIKSDMCLYFI
jgi:hypothetical protein